LAALLLAVAAVQYARAYTPPSSPLQRYEFQEAHMGTVFRTVLYARDPSSAAHAQRAAFQRIAELDARFSDYNPASELSVLVRRAADGPVPVSEDLFAVLGAAQALAVRTSGAFDVTAGASTHLWRRARRIGRLPTEADVEAARRASGYAHLMLDAADRTVRLGRVGVQLDLGGVAKGYAADAALAEARDRGVSRALVEAGGDVAAGDAPPGADGWEVRLADWDSTSNRGTTIVIARAAVSTSGDLEQWLEADGVRHSHIVDPRTGRALTVRRLVSVIASDATTSDMLATAASVLGASDALPLVDETPGGAILMGTEGVNGMVHWAASSRWPAPRPDEPSRTR
jgi:thiamine biosynthesis lipoprotein